ncbi:MAG: rod shape-determining protein MreC [Sediminibacterium sp.]
MLTTSSISHQTFFSAKMSDATSEINEHYYNMRGYFFLRETNQKLALENARLLNLLRSNISVPDSSIQIVTDSVYKDSLNTYRKYSWFPARVIGNTVSLQTNFLTLERGRLQGVKKGMAAICPEGIVGVVVEVSDNTSKVMSLLHRNSRVSAMLKKDNNAGSIEWDGASPYYLLLRNVSKGAKVVKGDTVVTSTYSANFPPYQIVGRVAEIDADPSSNFYTLKIKTAVNFFTVQFVYLVENLRYQEQFDLENNNSKTRE